MMVDWGQLLRAVLHRPLDGDLSSCPYFTGTGTCRGGCSDEPSCITDKPYGGWPSQRNLVGRIRWVLGWGERAGGFVYGWGGWRRVDHRIVGDEPYQFQFLWRRPTVAVIWSTDRYWLAWNSYPGALIGVTVGLPKLWRKRQGYPGLSLLWGRPGDIRAV